MNINQIKLYNPASQIAFRKESFYEGQKGFIFIVPEIWGNSQFLKNEFRLISDLKSQFGVQYFFCEGAFYEMPSHQTKAMLPKSAEEINSMFNAGQLKAQEYLALSSNEDIMIYGADKESMYNDQNSAYYAAREIYRSIQPFFDKVRAMITEVVNDRYPSEVVRIYNEIIRKGAHELFDQEITTFANNLVKFAQNANIPISLDDRIKTLLLNSNRTTGANFLSQLQDLKLDLNSTFSSEDPDDSFLKRVLTWQATNEEMSVNQILSLEYNQLFSLYQRACNNLRTLTNNTANILSKDSINLDAIEMLLSLVSVAKIDIQKYPDLFDYCHQRVLYEKTIKGSYHILGGYIDEVIIDQILNKLSDKGFLKNLYRFELDMYSLDQLFKTELINEQARQIPYLINKYSVENIIEFLLEIGVAEDKTNALNEYSFFWDQTIARTKRFYDNAFGRSNYMVNDCIQKLEKNKAQIAVLMAGGFHIQPIIRSLLRQGDYSFMVLQCQIGTINASQGRSDYDNLMDLMNKH